MSGIPSFRQFQQQMKLIESVESGILQVAENEERRLDEKIRAIEEMDEDDFEALREKRRQALSRQMRQEQDWKQLGHGVYSELTDTKEFFNTAKRSAKMVVHFFRGVTPRCQIVDAHLERLAQTHLETRFVKIDAEKNPFLIERLGVIIMPTIVLIKDGKTEHSLRGFDELGGTDDFSTEDMAYVLSTHGVLKFDGDRKEEIAGRAQRAGLNSMRLNTVKRGQYDELSDDENFDD
jgi:thiol-disulfide isomerase/thioredoxin